MIKNPVMFVVEVGAVFLTIRMLAVMFMPTVVTGFELQITLVALVHGAVCEFCRGDGRRPR